MAIALLAVLPCFTGAAWGQPAARMATTVDALGHYPLFFHGRTVVVRGTVQRPAEGVVSLRAGEGSRPVFLFGKGVSLPDEGATEVRGEFWDLGRLNADDPHLTGVDLDPLLRGTTDGRWPGHNQVLVLMVAAVTVPERLPPGLRAIALEPDRYEGRSVTVIGRFRGANLYGDLPQSPGRSRFDFVIQSADAAVWVTGQRPRGKGFNFDASRRLDTGRSLEITGVVHAERGLVWIDATRVELSTEAAPAAIVEAPARAPGPPPQVAFTLPVDEEADVAPAVRVRIQFTRDMAADTFRDRVRVSYTNANADSPPPPVKLDYRRDNRVLEITFERPLERFSSVKVELLEGITAFDGVPLGPWAMEFSVGSGE